MPKKGLQVINAGFQRTGTNSLRIALESLGYTPFHGYTLIENWNKTNHKSFWQNVYTNNGQNINWDDFYTFNNYDACCDSPSRFYWKELFQYYPNSKVILTIRNKHKWFKSWQNTIVPAHFDGVLGNSESIHFHTKLLKEISFCNMKYNVRDEQDCFKIFDEYNDGVINYFNDNKLNDKLMVIDLENIDQQNIMKNLSTFLGVNCDKYQFKNYPFTNCTHDYKSNFIGSMQIELIQTKKHNA
eukprot:172452_1